MNSQDVKNALLKRYPPAEYLSIYEAPQNSDRSGRKLDVVAVSLWKSRGLHTDGIEIKVSMSDWKRELDEPAKADWWHSHVTRFWIAAPTEVAKKIKPQLPPNWGLLSCAESGVRVSVAPEPNRNPEPFSWPSVVGLLRATAGVSTNILAHEYTKGYEVGVKQGEGNVSLGRVERQRDLQLERVTAERDLILAKVDAFEKASGIKLGYGPNSATKVGALVALVDSAVIQGPDVLDNLLVHEIDMLRQVADRADKVRLALASAFRGTPA